MLKVLLLAAGLCGSTPQPAPLAVENADAWKIYLTDMLHACYGYRHPVVARTQVEANSLATVGASLCMEPEEDIINCAILLEPEFLRWAPSSDHIKVIMAHEADHVASLSRPGGARRTRVDEEADADLFAALAVPKGACLLTDVYAWHLARTPKADPTDLPARIRTLTPVCAVQLLLP